MDPEQQAQMMRRIAAVATSCFEKIRNETVEVSVPAGYCPTIWDDLICWPPSPPGVLQKLPCPSYVPNINHQEYASKLCTTNGTWYYRHDLKKGWTNLTDCYQPKSSVPAPVTPDMVKDYLPVIKVVSLIGYAASLIALVLALTILLSIKRLRCPRNTLHMHLFASFLLRASMNLLKQILFSQSGGLGLPNSFKKEENGYDFNVQHPNWECKLVISIWQYAILSNYFWILMEGLYLFNLIFFAPFSDSSAITLYVVLGWGCPLIVVSAWVLARIYGDDTLCWTTHNSEDTVFNLFYIIQVPIIISIILNFILFLCIIWVLLVKLSSAVSIETRKYRYRKWAKSTLVLVPLFGVHYALLMVLKYYAQDNLEIEIIWLLCDQLFASFQGFFVSILYCLLNGEVRSELRKLWTSYWMSVNEDGRGIPMYGLSARFRSTGGDTTLPNECTEEHHLNDLSCYDDSKRGSSCGKRSIPRTVIEECHSPTNS